jgi:hypothetical protein
MDKLIIEDVSFSHSTSSTWYHKPKKFEWDRNTNQEFESIVVTNLNLTSVDKYPDKKVYGWIIEPPDILGGVYDFAKNNYEKFEKIFTYDKELLKISEKFDFLPIGGCWIDEEDQKIYEKNKLVCTINSSKRITEGHRFRHEVISQIEDVDLFGNGYFFIDKKIDVLKNYMFCIVIENQKMDYLFTEKIIDCFMTGTIPIYWGCPSINEFFNQEGFFTFDTIDELKKILSEINQDVYENKMKYIVENFDLSKKYTVADNLIFEKIKNEK